MSDMGLDRRLGYDPKLLAQMQYMLNAGSNPYMPIATPSVDTFGGGISAPEADEEYSIEDQNRQFTAMKSMMSLLSDPAFIANYGTMFGGGFSPQDVEPRYTYKPIEQPGRKLIESYLSSGGDSLEAHVAREIAGGATPTTIVNGLVTAWRDPDNEFHEYARTVMPKSITQPDRVGDPENWVDTPDTGALSSIVNNLYGKFVSDPEGPVDESGQPIIDPVTGRPAERTEEKNPIREYFQKTGLPYPWEPYDRDAFVDPERRTKEQELLDAWQQEQQVAPDEMKRLTQGILDEEIGLQSDKRALANFVNRGDMFDRQYDALGRKIAHARDVTQAAGPQTGGGRSSVRGDENFDRSAANQSYASYLGSLGGQEQQFARNMARDQGAPAPVFTDTADTEAMQRELLAMKRPTSAVTAESIAKRERRLRDQSIELRKRRNRNIQAKAEAQSVDMARTQREQQMKALQDAGYNPYNDVTRARQQALMSMFMGK